MSFVSLDSLASHTHTQFDDAHMTLDVKLRLLGALTTPFPFHVDDCGELHLLAAESRGCQLTTDDPGELLSSCPSTVYM